MATDREAKNAENIQTLLERLEETEERTKYKDGLNRTQMIASIFGTLLVSGAMFFSGLQYIIENATKVLTQQTGEIVKRLDTLVQESKREEKRNDNQDTRLERHEVQIQTLMKK